MAEYVNIITGNRIQALNFAVDDYLIQQCEEKDLSKVLSNLMSLKNENASEMSTVLQEKTSAVITLTEELQSIYTQIENLTTPVHQLQEMIQGVADRVKDAVSNCEAIVFEYKNETVAKCYINAMCSFKCIVKHTALLFDTFFQEARHIEFAELERVMFNFALYASFIKSFYLLREEHVEKADQFARALMNNRFKEVYRTKDKERLRGVLKICVDLLLPEFICDIIRKEIAEVMLKPVFCEDNLLARNYDMALVYKDAFNAFDKHMRILWEITKEENFEDFDIVLGCFWKVADKRLCMHMVCITAAGNADQFYDNYVKTQDFLIEIGRMLGNENMIYENESFIKHMDRFNTLVYYEIRHQTAVSTLEISMLKCSDFRRSFALNTVSKIRSKPLKLFVSQTLSQQITYLFSDGVFLPALSDQFLKSSLSLVARYVVWLDKHVAQYSNLPREDGKLMLIYFLRDIKILDRMITYAGDLAAMQKAIQSDDTTTLYRHVDPSILDNLQGLLSLKSRKFDKSYNFVKMLLIKIWSADIGEHLREVSSIPRLYRKTNRANPEGPSEYVSRALDIIKKFKNYYEGPDPLLLDDNINVFADILSEVSERYLKMVKEVLASVCKTEESLRRLKSRSSSASARNNSDEVKIRVQIKYDVKLFVDETRALNMGFERDPVGNLSTLCSLNDI